MLATKGAVTQPLFIALELSSFKQVQYVIICPLHCGVLARSAISLEQHCRTARKLTQYTSSYMFNFIHITSAGTFASCLAMISRLWFLASILPCLGILGHDVDLPGCPFETLTGKCKGEATCHSLAHSGLTCDMDEWSQGLVPYFSHWLR